MDPLTIAAGASAISALGQYMNSSAANKAGAKNAAAIKALYEKMTAPQFDENGTPQPGFDVSKLSPEDYKVLQQYVPQVAQQVKEVAPQVVTNTADMQTGRQAQMDALSKLRDVATTGKDPSLDAKLQQSSRTASIDAQSKIQSVLQDQERRGMLGSGSGLAAQLQGATSAMDRQAQTGSDAAIESYRNQLQAVRDSANLGGQVRSADESMQAKNADIINAYNARGAAAGQSWQNNRASTLNQAAQYNQSMAQSAADKNTQSAYDTARYNQQYGNQMAQQSYSNAETQRAALNQLKQNQFSDQMSINNGMAGAYGSQSAQTRQAAGDTNSAIAGLGNAVTAGAIYSDSQNRADARAGVTPAASSIAFDDDPNNRKNTVGSMYA